MAESLRGTLHLIVDAFGPATAADCQRVLAQDEMAPQNLRRATLSSVEVELRWMAIKGIVRRMGSRAGAEYTLVRSENCVSDVVPKG